MTERDISEQLVVLIIENGQIKSKPQQANEFWVFARRLDRFDNFVCISLVIDENYLVIKTVLNNWRPL